jgi:hypothetical protein
MGCCLCDSVESINYLLFNCHTANLVWSLLMNVFNLHPCHCSLEQLSNTWLQGNGPMPSRLIVFFLQGLHGRRGLQEIRWIYDHKKNKMDIEKSFLIKALTVM